MSSKKVVFYNACYGVEQYTSNQYLIHPINHPDTTNVSNMSAALTSQVVVPINDAGEFETMNSIYMPVFKL